MSEKRNRRVDLSQVTKPIAYSTAKNLGFRHQLTMWEPENGLTVLKYPDRTEVITNLEWAQRFIRFWYRRRRSKSHQAVIARKKDGSRMLISIMLNYWPDEKDSD